MQAINTSDWRKMEVWRVARLVLACGESHVKSGMHMLCLRHVPSQSIQPSHQCHASFLAGHGGASEGLHAPLQEFKGYIFKIMGGQDKQGFPMKQGVLVPGRVQLLMAPGDTCFRGYGRRRGERRRKSVRGCIVSQDLSVLNLVIVKKGGHCPMTPQLSELSGPGL